VYIENPGLSCTAGRRSRPGILKFFCYLSPSPRTHLQAGNHNNNAFKFRKLFQMFDKGKTGRVHYEDFRNTCETFGMQLDDDSLLALYAVYAASWRLQSMVIQHDMCHVYYIHSFPGTSLKHVFHLSAGTIRRELGTYHTSSLPSSSWTRTALLCECLNPTIPLLTPNAFAMYGWRQAQR